MAFAATAAPRPSRAPWAVQGLVAPVAPRTLVAVVHMVVDLASALVTSTPLILLAVVAVSTLPILPLSALLFALLLVGSRLAGHVERFRLAALTGVEITSPHRRLSGPWHRRMRSRLGAAATWKELGYHLVHLPKAVIFTTITVAAWSLGLALAALPVYVDNAPAGRAIIAWWTIEPGVEAWSAAAVGVVVLFTAPWLTRGLSRLAVGMADGLLGGGDAAVLQQRVDSLEASRADVVDAADVERRRIERDLHDGAQQRLVALAMSLGLAREKLDSDPEAARALVDEAHREAKSALVELRDLARGLHPPVLTDRGLAAAVAGLASRAPVPVEVDVRVDRRLPPSLEGIAYFVISETLTNVARHSGAHRARVSVVDLGSALVVEVSDDGMGGADAARGSGLRGLGDRARAVDGQLGVTSPIGGPTTVRAELPLLASDRRPDGPTAASTGPPTGPPPVAPTPRPTGNPPIGADRGSR